MAVQGQFARLTALAIATGTLVAAGAAPAGAASAPDSLISASGNGSALRLTVNLPGALAGTPLGTKIVQEISLTDGSVSTVSGPLANTTAVLGKGTTPVLSGLLEHSTSAVLSGEREQKSSGFELDQSGVRLSVLPLTSKVADPATDGVLAHSNSAVARLSLAGLSAPQLEAVTAPVADALETAVGTVSEQAPAATGTVGAVVNDAIGSLNAATDNQAAPVTAPVQAAIDEAVASLTGTLTDLTDTVGLLTSATDLVTLDSVSSDQVISRNGSEVSSTVSNVVKNINVLNGLVKISAVESNATAVAGGTPGSASASTKAPVLDVSLADGALTAVIDEKGLNLGGGVGSALPGELQGTVNDALATVNAALAETVGLDVQIGKGATSVSPDGTSAAAAVNATTITVNPLGIAELLGAGTEFLKLELVTANAAVGSQLVAVPAVAPATLPRTGGALPLTGALATLLVGAALVARRRRVVAVAGGSTLG
jgi:hypothetical protein